MPPKSARALASVSGSGSMVAYQGSRSLLPGLQVFGLHEVPSSGEKLDDPVGQIVRVRQVGVGEELQSVGVGNVLGIQVPVVADVGFLHVGQHGPAVRQRAPTVGVGDFVGNIPRLTFAVAAESASMKRSLRAAEPDWIIWPGQTVKHERAFEAASNTPR